ncbi:hypothetical protein E2C01_013469 [Portunus trituberculatus]|uniref:SH3 domain-containing protein n=1 Tax=Portunus trituberculatus TaxID=210409 RepID=A0A5B7DGC1_PORTR|nr:hypothetical protein [Portunus trituberculatus]
MGDVYVYTARQECRGASANEPGMEANDVIHVSAEFLQKQKMAPDSPNGWLYGTNMRTRQDGYFPAYFLVLNGARRRSNATPEGKPPLAEQVRAALPMNTCWWQELWLKGMDVKKED